ncbi:MAG: alpha/beta hydrolase [Proteobacteria bacterium]|nr:alpha/beta hydrolase [Pseudomonadota bacterium]
MPLDPQCAAIIEAAAATGGAPFEQQDPVAARRAYGTGTAAFRHTTDPLESVINTSFSGPGGPVPVRLYRPFSEQDELLPVVVFFHGGGWTIGDLDSHDHMCRHLALGAQACVIAVDYRLAPEHKFPAAFEDCVAAVQWVVASAAELKLDANRIVVAGDSAGGNLAAAVSIALRDMGGPKISGQVLMYPAVDFTADNPSIRENGSGYLLTRGALEMFADFYLPNRAARSDPRASPQLRSSHANLPRAFIQTAEFDPLRDEGRRYAETLMAAGTAVEYKCSPAMIHGFARMCARVDAAVAALNDSCGWLREEFAN